MDVFWYTMIVLFVVIPAIVIWFGCVIDAIARPDIGVFSKVLWSVAMLVLPFIGCAVYLITRPREIVVTETGMYDEMYGQGIADFPTTSKAGGEVMGRMYNKM